MSESPEDMGPESNFLAAAESLAQYISEKFKDMDSFTNQLSQLDKGMKSINQFADTVFNYYQDKQLLSFEIVKTMISRVKDVNLKMITDIVAYKIYQSPDDKGPELNFYLPKRLLPSIYQRILKIYVNSGDALQTLGKVHTRWRHLLI